MTDKEIIKALECCMNGRCDDECPFRETREHCHNLDSLILDLINRQQAEIDRWKKNCDDLYEQMSERQKAEVEIAKRMGKSEAIKEFAERLKEKPIKYGIPLLGLSTKTEIEEYFNDIMMQVRDAIDTVKKEMTGEAKPTDFPKDYSYGY